jgi:hypothetical protein
VRYMRAPVDIDLSEVRPTAGRTAEGVFPGIFQQEFPPSPLASSPLASSNSSRAPDSPRAPQIPFRDGNCSSPRLEQLPRSETPHTETPTHYSDEDSVHSGQVHSGHRAHDLS